MNEAEELLPPGLKNAYLGKHIKPTQKQVVAEVLKHLDLGENVFVSLPAGTGPVLISQVTLFERTKPDSAEKPKTLVIVPNDSGIEEYMGNIAWLEDSLRIQLLDTIPANQRDIDIAVAETDVLVATLPQLLQRLEKSQMKYKQLNEFQFAIIEERLTQATESFQANAEGLLDSLIDRVALMLYLSTDPAGTLESSLDPHYIQVKSRRDRAEKQKTRKDQRWRPVIRREIVLKTSFFERLLWLAIVIALLIFKWELLPVGDILATGFFFIVRIVPFLLGTIVVLILFKIIIGAIAWTLDVSGALDWLRDEIVEPLGMAILEKYGDKLPYLPVRSYSKSRRKSTARYRPSGYPRGIPNLASRRTYPERRTPPLTAAGNYPDQSYFEYFAFEFEVYFRDDDSAEPVGQFETSFQLGDDLFDDSFSIDSQAGEFLGECGVGIAETFATGDPRRVMAFEVWLFDKQDIQTGTKFILSPYAFEDDLTREKLSEKGELVKVDRNAEIVINTLTLQLNVRVIDFTLNISPAPPAGRTPAAPSATQVAIQERFEVVFQAGDDFFDESFSIDSQEGEFLGECGVHIASLHEDKNSPTSAAAFQVWLFDKNGMETKTAVLMSPHTFADERMHAKASKLGQPFLVAQENKTELWTQTLGLSVTPLEVVYQMGTDPDQAYFAQLVFDIRVWTLSSGKPEDMDTASWKLPLVRELLEAEHAEEEDRDRIHLQAKTIEETLRVFGALGTVVEIEAGLEVTVFHVELDASETRQGKVPGKKISLLADDLALALAASTVHVKIPEQGKGPVVIEVPKDGIARVFLRDLIESETFVQVQAPLRLVFGRDLSRKPVIADLEALPHLLIAGEAGSGIIAFINAIITSMLLQQTPDELRLIMIDLKQELANYNGIPHLLSPVVRGRDQAIGTMEWITGEMDARYLKLAEEGARSITHYNELMASQGRPKLPYLVVIIAELADLMLPAPDQAEKAVVRLAQLARATGIHLIIATRRPSVDVVTGLIKANIPARTAFAVASSVDSRVILDQPGAERLLGHGDMLFLAPDAPAPVRLQGVFVSDSEILRLVQYWRFQATNIQETIPMDTSRSADIPSSGLPLRQGPIWEEMAEEDNQDPLFNEAVALIRRQGRASISMLQRRLRIGYTRAARLVETMEDKGIVGPPEGATQTRQVLDYGPAAPPAGEN